jgi:pimeloyl-ACP methyl ester carboxylesterase
MYAQAHPEKVAGFVSMNPSPPSETFMDAAKKVETKAEFAEEQSFERGANEENTSFQEPTLRNPLPASMPYAVMFDESCEGDSDFCSRILPPLIQTTESLAAVGDGGRFVRAKGAGTGRTMMCRTQAVILAYESGLVQPGAPASWAARPTL